jgi:hypothetical protein
VDGRGVGRRLGIRAVARVFEVDPNTVPQWLVEAVDQGECCNELLLETGLFIVSAVSG